MSEQFDDALVTGALERAVADGAFPGAVLLVADGREILYLHSAGAAELVPAHRPATIDTVYDLASLTKPLATTLLAMQLVDQDRLDLDQPVRTLLPEFGHPAPRVRNLLSHSSGLPAHRRYWEHPEATSREAFFALACREPLEYEPGTQSVYSDVGFLVLGRLLETIAGSRLDERFRALSPDGLRFGPVADAAATEVGSEGAATTGVVHDENARAMGGVAPHAGLFGTARGVHALLLRLTSGDLVSSQTQSAFFSPAGVPGSTWGLGWDHPATRGASASGSRLPRSAVGHLAFTGCSIWMDPSRPFWIVLLSNRIHPSRDNVAIRHVRPALHDAVCVASGVY